MWRMEGVKALKFDFALHIMSEYHKMGDTRFICSKRNYKAEEEIAHSARRLKDLEIEFRKTR